MTVAAIAPGVVQVTFNPIDGTAFLGGWRSYVSPDADDIPRVRLPSGDLGTGLFMLLAELEAFAIWKAQAPSVGTPAAVPPWDPYDGLTLGASATWARKAARAQDPIGLAYMAGQNIARWSVLNIDPPSANDPVAVRAPIVPIALSPASSPGLPLQRSGGITTVSAPVLAITVGVIGVAAAVAAAVAYWSGKREDALAAVRVKTLAAAGATDAGLKLAQAQLAAGQPIDPKVFDLFQAVGAGKEVSRDWGDFVWPGVAGLAVGGGTAVAVYKTK